MPMMGQKAEKFDAVNRPSENEKNKIVDFLYEHLDEYGDARQDIRRALDYSIKERASFGGFILTLKEQNKMVGAVVVNETGMSGYIPENILVYIATHKDHRGKGIGKKLMEDTMNYAKGDVALHVEKDNPARFLYEKYGFKNPYLEMRFKR
jgi:ribosomal protein S18 acetylase RimI-like enzyme